MSGQSISLGESRRVVRPVADRPKGLARDLPLVLFADALILLGALSTWGLNCTLPQTLAALGILAGVSFAIIAWFAVQYRADLTCHSFLVLQAAWTYWYLVPMLLTSFRGSVLLDLNERDFTPVQLAQAAIAVFLAKFTSTLIYQIVLARPVIDVERIAIWLNRRSYPMPVWPVAGLLGLGLLPFLFSGKPLLNAILSSRSADGIFPTSNFSGVGPGLFAFTSFLTACCLLAFYRSLLTRERLAKWSFFLLGLISVTISALAFSTRSMLLASLMPALTLYLLGSPDRWRMVKVGACLIGLWICADLLVSSRQQGFLQQDKGQKKLSRNLVDNDFFAELLFAMSIVPDRVPYDYASPVAIAVTTLIPRSLWPNKPVQVNGERVMRLRVNYINGRELSGNVLPGIVGQYWEDAGWLGAIAAGIWLGIATGLWDRIIVASNWNMRYLSFAFVWALFISFRTLALSNFLPAILCLATVLALSRSMRIESTDRE